MNKRHKLITVLLVILLSAVLAITLIACDNNSNENTAKDTGEFISNGNFALTSSSGNSYPKTPSSWTGSAGSLATNNATDTDSKSLVSGVINTEKSAYNANKGSWGNLTNPFKHGQDDDNVLMIYNKTNNSYKYTSSSFSVDANKYYHISAWVKTAKLTGSAYVIITGDAYHEFEIGDTRGEWVNVSMYIETTNVSSNSLSIVLSNGRFGKNDGSLSQGYAFFDDITVTELSDIEGGKTAAEQFSEISVSDSVAKQSLKLGDSSFININNTLSQPYTPANWSGTTSTGEGGTAPTGSDQLEKGIFDLSQPTSSVNSNVTAIGADSFVLGIHAKQKTAYSYRSSKKVRFESNGYYKLTINVNTFIEDNIPSTAGAFLRIKSTTGTDDILAEVDAINTNGTWKTATLYIKADQRKNLDLYVEVGFGKGGKDSLENVRGQAYFDNLALEEITETEYNAPEGEFFVQKAIGTELDPANNTINNPSFDNPISDTDWYKGVYGKNDNIANSATVERLDTTSWNDINGINPLTPNSNTRYVMAIRNNVPTVSKVGHKIEQAKANTYYRLGFWVKTTDIPKDKGLTVTLYKYDNTVLDPITQYTGTSLSSISNFNTASLDSTENNNGYTELVFLIEGDSVKDNEYYLEFSLGSGTFFTANSHVMGNAYITDVSLYPISYSDYQSESGTYVKKYSFKSSGGTIANYDFNNVNVSDTMDAYELENYYSTDDVNGLYDAQGNRNYFGLPTSWTTSDKSYLNVLNAGIVNSSNNTLLNKLNANINIDNLYNGLDKVFGANVSSINPNLLVIGTKPSDDSNKLTVPTNVNVCGCTCEKCVSQGYCDGNECANDCDCLHTGYSGAIRNTWGFTSPSISLSANSYYKVSVWARLYDGSASVTLKPSSKVDVKSISITDKINGWKEYSFYVETGFDSTSVNLELTLGDVNDTNAASYNGLVMFDMPTLTTIDSETYEAALNTSEITTVSYTYTTFDNTTQNDESLDTPTGWTGENTDGDAPNKDTEQAHGVYNRDHGNRNWLGTDENRIQESELLDILNGKTADGNGGFTYATPDNDNVLVINNKVASEYTYSNTLARSLDKSSFYEISIRVLTKDVEANKYATIKLDLNNNHFTFGLNEEKGIKVNTNGAWTTYTFLISTPDEKSISTVTINLSLGLEEEENYVQGYAFFDDVRIAKLNNIDTSEDFDEYTANMDESKTMKIVLTNDDVEKENEPTPTEKGDPLLWLYITSGVIGGLIVIVVIVFLFKKFYKPRKKNNFKKDAPSYSRDASKTKSNNKVKDVKKTYKD